MRSSLWLLVVVLACGKSSDKPGQAPPASGDKPAASGDKPAAAGAVIDACTLVSKEDVVAALGRADFSAGKSKDGGMNCRFASSRGSVTVYSQAAPRSQWDELKATLVRENKTIADLPGIGDAAYYWEQRLYVYRRDREVTIHISPHGMSPTAEDNEKDKASALALAKIVVGKLP